MNAAFQSLAGALAAHARAAPDAIAIALESSDGALSYGRFWQRIVGASALLRQHGIRAGDRVAYLGLNHADQIAVLAAAMRLGAIFVPLNYRLAAPELRAIVEHAGAALLIADDELAALGRELVAPLQSRAAFSAALDGGACATDAADDVSTAADANAPALLVYTSGTTGRPKGALHTQGGLWANARASVAMHDMTAADRILSVLPMFHVGGLCIQTVPALYAGAGVLLHSRFDAGRWLHAVAHERPTLSLLVPATMRAVIEHPQWTSTDLSSLRILGAGSSTIPDALIEAFHARGVPVCQIYGTTETGPVSIVLRADEAFARVGVAGRPASDCAVRLVDADGNDVRGDGVGEIRVRAPNVMAGYWRDPSNPAFADGWFRTGDLARRDPDGYYTVVGRAQDMIISGGENIHPAEIESVLAGVAGIAEVTAIGVPDAQWGEVAVAVVVLRPGATLDEAAVRNALDAALARFKHPRRIVVRESLPRNAMGKVQKQALLAELG